MMSSKFVLLNVPCRNRLEIEIALPLSIAEDIHSNQLHYGRSTYRDYLKVARTELDHIPDFTVRFERVREFLAARQLLNPTADFANMGLITCNDYVLALAAYCDPFGLAREPRHRASFDRSSGTTATVRPSEVRL